MIIEQQALDGRPLVLNLPDPTAGPTAYILAVHKAGSVLFNGIVQGICTAAGRATFDLEPQVFGQGVPMRDCPLDAAALLEREGYVFTGFRAPWLLGYVRRYRQAKKLLIVRDPRDIAVSFYFSMASSHRVPTEGAARSDVLKLREMARTSDVSAFVLAARANPIFQNLNLFLHQIHRYPGFVVYRYEDVIFAKREWSEKIAAELEIDLPRDVLHQIADRHDIIPAEEAPDQHVRQVTPGNYKKHLDRDAIQLIEERCAAIFDRFHYTRDGGTRKRADAPL